MLTAPTPSTESNALAADRRVVSSIAVGAVAAAVGGALAAVVAGRLGVALVVLGIAGAAAVVDAQSGRLPNSLVLAAAVAALVGGAIVSGASSMWSAAVALGVLGAAGPLMLGHLVAPAALGFGDVKLAAALGVLIADGRGALLAVCGAAGVAAAYGILRRRPTVAMGPGLVIASTAVVVSGAFGGVR